MSAFKNTINPYAMTRGATRFRSEQVLEVSTISFGVFGVAVACQPV